MCNDAFSANTGLHFESLELTKMRKQLWISITSGSMHRDRKITGACWLSIQTSWVGKCPGGIERTSLKEIGRVMKDNWCAWGACTFSNACTTLRYTTYAFTHIHKCLV